MERFKAIMKKALAMKAIRIKVESGKHAHIVTAKGPDELRDMPLVDEALMKLLYGTFFHKEQASLAEGKPTKGFLHIAGLDKLKLIAEPKLNSLKIFIPPEGEAMFQTAWANIENAKPAAAGTIDPGMNLFTMNAPGEMAGIPLSPAPTPTAQTPTAPTPPVPARAAPPAFMADWENAVVADDATPPNSVGKAVPASMPSADQDPSAANMFTIKGLEDPMPNVIAKGEEGISYTPLAPEQLDAGIPKIIPSQQPVELSPSTYASPESSAPLGETLDFQLNHPARPKAAATPQEAGLSFSPQASGKASREAGLSLSPHAADDASRQTGLSLSPHAAGETAPAPFAPMTGEPVASKPASPAKTSPVASHHPEPATNDLPLIPFGAHVPGSTIERRGDFPVDEVLRDMIQRKASDLHLTPGEPVCMRIDGDIVRLPTPPLSAELMERYILPIMPPVNHKEFATIHDTDFAYELPGVARFRVNVYRDLGGVGAVMRQIPSTVLSAKQLGLPPAIRKFCELSKGLVVVTGPTGSGKSTTLAGMIDLINETRSDHILTIEDPVEFVHKQKNCLINQREIHRHTTSFKRALKAALREDPDIVLIGEMRDLETIAIAIETAETGHLVFGTLHTNTAVSTVDRIIDQFPSNQQAQIRVMLAESLKGVVAQTLLKKKGGGRVAAHEILVANKAVSSLIREGKTHMIQNIMQTQKAEGNVLLNETLFNLVTAGLVDPREAYLKAVDKDPLLQMFSQKGIQIAAGLQHVG